MIQTILRYTYNAILRRKRKPYIERLRRWIRPTTTIISSNCFAGRLMQDLNMKYNSPTLGLYFMYPDYIEFLSHLKFYLTEAKLTFVKESKYPIGNFRRAKYKHWYPIALLGDKVEIHFLHYHSESEASEKWYRRSKRINWNDLIIIGMDQNLCTSNDIVKFKQLPFQRKVFFTSNKDYSGGDVIYVSEFKNKDTVGDPYKKGHIFYRYLADYADKNFGTNNPI